jgi:ABC-type transporter Mla subunit MlaD
MKNRTKEAVVGFVSILAITVLIISIIYGKNISLNTEKKVITVLFKTVNGLDIGSKVFVKGVPCGTVKSVDLSNKNVIVKADIDSKINIYTDATATVENKEIMGGKMLVIHVGHSEILLADKPINGKSSKGMNEAISEIADIMTHAKTLIENTDALIVKVTKFIPETDLDQKFDEIANETLSTMKSIKTTMNSVTSLNKRVEELTDPKGSIGKLVSSDEFYMKLDRAVTNIDSLVKKIDREGLKTNIDIW